MKFITNMIGKRDQSQKTPEAFHNPVDPHQLRFRVFLSFVALLIAVVAIIPVYSYFNPPVPLEVQMAINAGEAAILEFKLLIEEEEENIENIKSLKFEKQGIDIVNDPFVSDSYLGAMEREWQENDYPCTKPEIDGYDLHQDDCTYYPINCINGGC